MKLSVSALFLVLSLSSAESGSYAYYNCFLDDPSLNGYYSDGFTFDGPFRANGPVAIYSSTPGRDNDPWFYSFTLSSDYYLYGTGSSGVQCSTPQYENLWIEPYELMQQGSPWFNLGAEPLPFGPDYVDWQSIRTAAQNGGLELVVGTDVTDGSRLILRGDSTLTIMYEQFGTETVYDLSTLDNPAIWIENPGERIYLRGSAPYPFDSALTIGMMGDLFFSGELLCEEEGFLGIVSVYGDLVIADDPETPEPGWPGYEIQTDESFTFQCSMMALDGIFQAEIFYQPIPQAVFSLAGGMQVCEEGFTSSTSGGFSLAFPYDERLLTESPPFYPEYQLSGIENAFGETVEPLFLASPNPFSSSVQFSLPFQGEVEVYDQSGRVVARSGICSQWVLDGGHLPSGVYIAVASGPSEESSFLRLVKVD